MIGILSLFTILAAAHAAVIPSTGLPTQLTKKTDYTAWLQKQLDTGSYSAETLAEFQALVALDAQLKNGTASFYQGDGKTQPTLSYADMVAALPAGQTTTSADVKLAATAVDATTTAFMKNWVQLASTAYCELSTLQAWSCVNCRGTNLGQLTNIQFQEISNTRFYAGIQGGNKIVVAFRGSANAANWISNLNFGQKQITQFTGASSSIYVHSGFFDLHIAQRSFVRNMVNTLRALKPTAPVYFIGHSLGGSLAALAAMDYVANAYAGQTSNVYLVTAGEPRGGNLAYAQWVSAALPNRSYRGVNEDDIVPHLPYQWLGFRHHLRQYWINNGVLKTCNDVSASDLEDTDCANVYVIQSTSAHLNFLGVTLGSGGC